MAIRLLNHASMAVPLPLADDMLAGWDAALGLDWPAYFAFVADRPALSTAMDWSYTSLSFFSVVAFILLVLFADARRCLCFVEAFAATAILCTVWGAFFPAMGSADRFLGAHTDFGAFAHQPGDWFIAPLSALREGVPVNLRLDGLPGLVTFPSFHTAAGVLLIGIARGSRLFVPALAYAILMIAATPIYGGHYFADLVAGAVIAAVLFRSYSRLPRYRGAAAASTGETPLPSFFSGMTANGESADSAQAGIRKAVAGDGSPLAQG